MPEEQMTDVAEPEVQPTEVPILPETGFTVQVPTLPEDEPDPVTVSDDVGERKVWVQFKDDPDHKREYTIADLSEKFAGSTEKVGITQKERDEARKELEQTRRELEEMRRRPSNTDQAAQSLAAIRNTQPAQADPNASLTREATIRSWAQQYEDNHGMDAVAAVQEAIRQYDQRASSQAQQPQTNAELAEVKTQVGQLMQALGVMATRMQYPTFDPTTSENQARIQRFGMEGAVEMAKQDQRIAELSGQLDGQSQQETQRQGNLTLPTRAVAAPDVSELSAQINAYAREKGMSPEQVKIMQGFMTQKTQ